MNKELSNTLSKADALFRGNQLVLGLNIACLVANIVLIAAGAQTVISFLSR